MSRLTVMARRYGVIHRSLGKRRGEAPRAAAPGISPRDAAAARSVSTSQGRAGRTNSAVIHGDADRFQYESRLIKKFVDKHVAHHAAKAKPAATFADLHDAIDALVGLTNRYGELLIQGGASEPVVLEDWKQVFRVAWLPPLL